MFDGGGSSSAVSLVLFDPPTPGAFDELSKLGDGIGAPKSLEGADLLCRAAAALVRQRAEQKKPFDVVHLHDWPAALVPHYAGAGSAPASSPIHDVQRQGRFPSGSLRARGRAPRSRGPTGISCCARACSASAADQRVPELRRKLHAREISGALAEVFAGASEAGDRHRGRRGLRHLPTPPPIRRWTAATTRRIRRTGGRTKAAVLRHFGLELELERPLAGVRGAARSRKARADLILAALPRARWRRHCARGGRPRRSRTRRELLGGVGRFPG